MKNKLKYLSIILLFCSCQKELSKEKKKKCGIVIAKVMNSDFVEYSDSTVAIFPETNKKVGEEYCH